MLRQVFVSFLLIYTHFESVYSFCACTIVWFPSVFQFSIMCPVLFCPWYTRIIRLSRGACQYFHDGLSGKSILVKVLCSLAKCHIPKYLSLLVAIIKLQLEPVVPARLSFLQDCISARLSNIADVESRLKLRAD